jgi:exosortase
MSPRIFWLLVVVTPLPLVVVYLWRLWDIEQYSFFPVVFSAISLLAYNRWDKQFRFPSTWSTTLLLGTSILLQATASLLWSPWIAFLGFLLAITSFFSSQREVVEKEGQEPFSAGSLFYLSIPLWLCLRIPLGQDQLLTFKLQHITARSGSYILDYLRIPHQITGVVFDLPGGKLFVEEACSGVQSLFALLCIAFLLLAFNRRPIILIPVYAAAAIFSAGLFNIVRVTAIAIAQERYAYNLAEGIPHEVLGYTCLIAAMLLLASFDRLFRVVFFPLSDAENPLARQRIPNPFKLLWNRTLTLRTAPKYRKQWQVYQNVTIAVFLGTISLMAIGLQVFFGAETVLANQNSSQKPAPIWLPASNTFVSSDTFVVESYQRKQGEDDISEGEYVDVWTVYDKSSQLRHRIAVSQPYKIYHDLCVCYRGSGWQQLSKERIASPAGGQATTDWSYVYSTYANAGGGYGYLSFSGFDGNGNPLDAPEESISGLVDTRLLSGRLYKTAADKVIMFQIWTTTDGALDVQQQSKLQELQTQLRQQIVDSLRAQTAISP